MPPARRHLLALLLLALDALALAAAWWVAVPVRASLGGGLLLPLDEALAHALWPAVVLTGLGAAGLRGRYVRPEEARGFLARLVDAAVALGVLVAGLYLAKVPHLSRVLLVGFWGLAVPLWGLTGACLRAVARQRPVRPLRLALVGPTAALDPWVAEVDAHPEWGVSVAERVGVDDLGVARWEAILRAASVDEVRLVALPVDDRAVAEVVRLCAELGLTVTVDLDGPGVDRRTLRLAPRTSPAAVWKRTVDVVGALVGLLLAWAPLLALAWVVRRADGASPWFVQERVGLRGRTFPMIKLRTMVPEALSLRAALEPLNEVDGPRFKLTDDPRITPLGRVLRRWSIDELPQLVNVLRGEMSLVGPRPALPEEVACYGPQERRRLSVKPGLTGLWQVSGRCDLPYAEGLALDLTYVDRASPGLDLWVLWRTLPAVVSGRGAR